MAYADPMGRVQPPDRSRPLRAERENGSVTEWQPILQRNWDTASTGVQPSRLRSQRFAGSESSKGRARSLTSTRGSEGGPLQHKAHGSRGSGLDQRDSSHVLQEEPGLIGSIVPLSMARIYGVSQKS